MEIAVAAPERARALPGQKSPTAVLALAILLLVPALITAYYRAFMGIEPFDDEGALIEMVRSFLSGRPLYDSVPSIYGPTFFLYQRVAHALAGSPVTTDSVRFVSVAFWLGSGLLVFVVVYLGTRSWAIAAAAFVAAFSVLSFIGEDPAHPQELCLVLVLALIVAGCYANHRALSMLWMGGLAGALVMTKINIGALMVVAVGLVLAHATRWGILQVAATAGALGFVWMLMTPLLGMSWAWRYFILVELSLLAVIVSIARTPFDVRVGARELAMAAMGFIGVVAALALVVIATGSTLRAMIEWLIVKPRSAIGPGWFWAPKIGAEMMWWASVGLAAAVLARTRILRPWMIVAMKLALATVTAILIKLLRFDDAMTVVPPFLWLVTMPEDDAARQRLGSFGRALLAVAGVLTVLYAYPVAGGTQENFVGVVLICVMAVALGDAVCWVADRIGGLAIWGRRLAYAAMVLVLFRFCVLMPVQARQDYDRRPALGLPGAQRLHLTSGEVAGLRAVTGAARESCGMLITAPGMPSFNLWTGLPAPKGLPAGNWMTGLNDAAQEKMVREVAGEPKLCVMYSNDMIAMWTHRADLSQRPMIRFIRENFRPVVEGRRNVLMVRR